VNTCQQQTSTFRGAETISRRLTLTLAALIVFSLGASMALAQVPVINLPLKPEQKVPGSTTFTLTVNGEGFLSDAVVYWNGTALTTTFVKSSQLTASVPTADLVTAGTAQVTVKNGTGVGSNVANFQVVKSSYTVAYSKLDYATDTTPQDVVAAHFTSSGFLDLAVCTGNNTISVLLGNGTGKFPTHKEYAVPGNPVAIIAGDFNGDGKIDLATVDQFQSEISILLGNGDGTFQGHKEYATAASGKPVALATADVNGDGKLDIIVANQSTNNVSVLLGNGDGTFQAHTEYSVIPTGKSGGPLGLAIGDFNGDGKLDLAVANNSDNAVAIMFGNGDGSFQTPIEYTTATAPNSVVVGDFNGDGILDLAVGTSNKSVSVLLGISGGTFQNHKEYTIGANAVVVAAADLGSNGRLSLISANYNDNSVSTLGGNSNGTFASASTFPVSGGPTGLAVGDFNGNGKLDIAVVASGANTVSILTDSWISLSPGLINFGTQTSGFKSAAKNVTVKNNGTTAWTMGTPSFAGLDNTDFTQTNTCPTPNTGTLAAGKTCTISVIFEPTASENADAQVLITETDGTDYGNVLQGSGNIPITLTPRYPVFSGYTLIGTTTAPIKTTFTNNSGVNIVFTLIDLEGQNAADFTLDPTSPCLTLTNKTLLPGASCTTSVTYHPTITGGETVTEVFYGNFTLAKQGSIFSGKGTQVKVTPGKITFPTCKVGSTCTGVVTIQNTASFSLTINGAFFTNGTPPIPFSVQSNTCGWSPTTNGTVAANSSCTFTLAYSPTVVGTQTATFNIGDTDPTGPQMVSLTGTGD
jgi:hypothetical protein